jgi:hypothetical protein
MRFSSPLPSEPEGGSVTMTARHMADAVGYLTRVANDAGLRSIAGKLTNVRTSLLKVMAGGADEGDPAGMAAKSATRSKMKSGGASKADKDEHDG